MRGRPSRRMSTNHLRMGLENTTKEPRSCADRLCVALTSQIKSLGSDVIRRLSAAWCGTTSRRKNTVLEEPQPTPIGPVYCPPVS